MFNAMATETRLFHRITKGIRITARPLWLPDESDPPAGQFVFGYRIRIENTGAQPVQLITRRWLIHDDVEGDSVVEGEGVVGQQPHLAPGEVHEYASYCVLKSPTGWMEGSYHFVRADGTTVDAAIPRFFLITPGRNPPAG
jgi:ApaG protein